MWDNNKSKLLVSYSVFVCVFVVLCVGLLYLFDAVISSTHGREFSIEKNCKSYRDCDLNNI